MLNAELEMCTYQIAVQINYLYDTALNDFQISGKYPEKISLNPSVIGFKVLRACTSPERFVSILFHFRDSY